ncbi:MAG: hypothetical protein WC677_07660 [Clostridia bacterium]|jgi:hypothetical protein
MDMIKALEALVYAKDNVRWLLVHEAASIDTHGLVYWAGEVERLRKEIKSIKIKDD